MTKIPVTKDGLDNMLLEQLDLLEFYCDTYDAGKNHIARDIAVKLRTFFYDGKGKSNSKPLISLLSMESMDMLSTANIRTIGALPYNGLGLANGTTQNKNYIASLDASPSSKKMTFADWWNEIILIDISGNEFTRQKLVAHIVDTDGGAHVDDKIDENYSKLRDGSSLNIFLATSDNPTPLKNAHYASIRQIGHETLKSFLPSYNKKYDNNDDFLYGDLSIREGSL